MNDTHVKIERRLRIALRTVLGDEGRQRRRVIEKERQKTGL
jgi:hypothetical protein